MVTDVIRCLFPPLWYMFVNVRERREGRSVVVPSFKGGGFHKTVVVDL